MMIIFGYDSSLRLLHFTRSYIFAYTQLIPRRRLSSRFPRRFTILFINHISI